MNLNHSFHYGEFVRVSFKGSFYHDCCGWVIDYIDPVDSKDVRRYKIKLRHDGLVLICKETELTACHQNIKL